MLKKRTNQKETKEIQPRHSMRVEACNCPPVDNTSEVRRHPRRWAMRQTFETRQLAPRSSDEVAAEMNKEEKEMSRHGGVGVLRKRRSYQSFLCLKCRAPMIAL